MLGSGLRKRCGVLTPVVSIPGHSPARNHVHFTGEGTKETPRGHPGSTATDVGLVPGSVRCPRPCPPSAPTSLEHPVGPRGHGAGSSLLSTQQPRPPPTGCFGLRGLTSQGAGEACPPHSDSAPFLQTHRDLEADEEVEGEDQGEEEDNRAKTPA